MRFEGPILTVCGACCAFQLIAWEQADAEFEGEPGPACVQCGEEDSPLCWCPACVVEDERTGAPSLGHAFAAEVSA